MRWVEVKPEPVSRPIEERAAGESFVAVLLQLAELEAGAAVVFDEGVRAGIRAHLLTSRNELGGLLLGRAFQPPLGALSTWGDLTLIEDFVPCRDPRSTGVSLAMESDVWDEARRRAGASGRVVVGWYHSHPNLGAFFSGRNVTAREWMGAGDELALAQGDRSRPAAPQPLAQRRGLELGDTRAPLRRDAARPPVHLGGLPRPRPLLDEVPGHGSRTG
jgi:hypothetical protein